MKLKIRAGFLMLLICAAAYAVSAAYATLQPKSHDELPMQIYSAFIEQADGAQFFLRSCGGYVAVYRDANFKTEPELTAIETTELRSADRAMLDRGIPVRGRSELLELLEDLGS